MTFTRKREPLKGTRFDMREIVLRVEKLRTKRGVTVKNICDQLGIERWDYSRKVRVVQTKFTIEELGLIADAVEEISGKSVPIGWPFLSEEIAEFLQSALAAGAEARPKRG
jgi:hypothetical protein